MEICMCDIARTIYDEYKCNVSIEKEHELLKVDNMIMPMFETDAYVINITYDLARHRELKIKLKWANNLSQIMDTISKMDIVAKLVTMYSHNDLRIDTIIEKGFYATLDELSELRKLKMESALMLDHINKAQSDFNLILIPISLYFYGGADYELKEEDDNYGTIISTNNRIF